MSDRTQPIPLSEVTDITNITFRSKQEVDIVLNDLSFRIPHNQINTLLDIRSGLPDKIEVPNYLDDLPKD